MGLKETLENEKVGMYNFTLPFLLFQSIDIKPQEVSSGL
jgi:hypothetical protein